MVSFLETVAASKEEWEEHIRDQWNEIEDKSCFAEDSFTTGLGIFGFSLSVLHAEILERICEFPIVTEELRAQELLTGQAARERDAVTLAELEELMKILVVKKDPRTNVTHWLFRIVPRLVLKHEMLARWIVGVTSQYWITHLLEKAKQGISPNLPFLAYVVLIQGLPLRGHPVRANPIKFTKTDLMQIDAWRRNLPLSLIDASRTEEKLFDHEVVLDTRKSVIALRTGLAGSFYASHYDEDYYWAVTDQLMLRTFIPMVRQIEDCELHRYEESLPEIFPVISAKGDRLEGRYVSMAGNEVNQVELKTSCGPILRRNLEMINWFSVADPMPGPLDYVIDEWDCEQLRRGRPQPVESMIYRKTLQGLGQSTEGPACLTTGISCNEKCLCVRNVITRPAQGSAAVKSVLMSHVTDRSELETWVAAITEHTPEESYSLLCALASTESIGTWQEDRHLVFMATESWRAELTPQAKAAFQNNGLALDDFMMWGCISIKSLISQCL